MPILVCFTEKKIRAISGLSGRLSSNDFSSRKDVFLKGPLFSKATLNVTRFDTKFVGV